MMPKEKTSTQVDEGRVMDPSHSNEFKDNYNNENAKGGYALALPCTEVKPNEYAPMYFEATFPRKATGHISGIPANFEIRGIRLQQRVVIVMIQYKGE